MNINLKEYHFDLPEERIAKYPAEPRDSSKLLVYKNGKITHDHFFNLSKQLPENSFLFFNNTKVIPARLFFQKSTGPLIEVFLLEPILPTKIVSIAMQSKNTVVWLCMVGNKKRWKPGEKLYHSVTSGGRERSLQIEYENFEQNLVRFTWDDEKLNWADILQIFGEVPLPPYFNRKPDKEDENKYQTVFAKQKGAVAAPTAGLHFSEKVISAIEARGINKDFITLHVSAGTFQPIKVQNAVDHVMHSEQIIFTTDNIENIINNYKSIIAIGTTSLRALESLYWFAVKLYLEKDEQFFVEKLYPYKFEKSDLPEVETVLNNLLTFLKKKNKIEIIGETEIFIFPGYKFKLCKGLVTNYHLPETTLILLVAAFVGEDWRKIYQEALTNNYRFLSYGDSSLLLP